MMISARKGALTYCKFMAQAVLPVLLLLTLVAGCGGGGASGSPSTEAASPATGTISMHLADARPLLPAGTEKVLVTLSSISLYKEEGQWVSLPMPANPYTVDLLALSNGVSVNFITPVALTAGKYTKVRVGVASATITIGGTDYPVDIPADAMLTDRTVEIDIVKGSSMEITLDFDLSRSIVTVSPGSWRLYPVIHIVKTSDAAILEGILETGLFGTSAEVEVTLLTGGEEYTSLIVEKSDPVFRIYWLDPGMEYTLRVEAAGEVITEKTIPYGDILPASVYTTTITNPGPRVKLGDWGTSASEVVRFRSFNNTSSSELYIGPNPISSGYPNRVETNLTWTQPGAHSITVTYDPDSDSLSATMGGMSLVYGNVSTYSLCPVANWNAMQIVVVNRDAGTTVNLDNVTLGGYELGSFSGGAGSVLRWTVTHFDFTRNFTLAGTVSLAGTFSDSPELSKIEIYIGCK